LIYTAWPACPIYRGPERKIANSNCRAAVHATGDVERTFNSSVTEWALHQDLISSAQAGCECVVGTSDTTDEARLFPLCHDIVSDALGNLDRPGSGRA
jgi:hypothetical protein